MADNRPIGVFDSGLGGLSVLRALVHLLLGESFLYLADSGYCPYGARSMEEIQDRTFRITGFLLEQDVKMIVVACNTATAAAIDLLRANYTIPFIGIEPAVKQAALHTRSGKVGVLATRNTFKGRLFKETSARYANDKDLFIQTGDGLVEIVEEGRIHDIDSVQLLQSYIGPMIEAGVDQIVLGCTHYPFLIPLIRTMVPESVVIHDPSPAVARQTERVMDDHRLRSSGVAATTRFFTTGETTILDQMVSKLDIQASPAVKISL